MDHNNCNAAVLCSLQYREFLVPQLEEFDQDTWFQQDGDTAHTARASVIRSKIIPGKSHSIGFFLWRHLKSRVYVNRPRTRITTNPTERK